eukprot:gene2287-8575_t
MFDDNSQSLSISNKYGNSRLALFPDSIEINATRVNIGDYNLKATPDGLVFCKFGKNCKPSCHKISKPSVKDMGISMSKIETLDEDSWYFKLPGCNCSRNKIQCGNIGPELKHNIEAMCKLLAAQDFVSLHLNVCAYVLKHERFKEV